MREGGPPLCTCLEWVGIPANSAALAALFSGDLFLARYAGNYFAKELLPVGARNKTRLATKGLEQSRICLTCWVHRSEMHLEDEAHVMFDCWSYGAQRNDFIKELSNETSMMITTALSSESQLSVLLRSHCPRDWKAIGRFIARVRQVRRKMKINMTVRQQKILTQSFYVQKKAWRDAGKQVCRHGVFFDIFDTRSRIACPCTDAPLDADWNRAVLMPTISDELKCIVVDTFDQHLYQKLGVVQAEIRRRGW